MKLGFTWRDYTSECGAEYSKFSYSNILFIVVLFNKNF